MTKNMKTKDETTIETPAAGEPTGINEAAVTTAVDEDLLQVLRTENEELRSALRIRNARDTVGGELRKLGARSPDLLLNAVQDRLQFDEEDAVINSVAVVEGIKREFPEQFGRDAVPSIDGGAGTGGPQKLFTKEALAKMSPDEIAKLDWDEVRQVLKS